jgi:Tol biopolymer transport system component
MRRITTDRANDNSPRLSPDGRQIVFSSDRNGGVLNLYATDTQGGTESLLLQTPQDKNPADWSPDGRYVLYQTQNVRTGKDLWALPLGGDKTPFPVSEASGTEGAGRFSPDGRWVAFSSSQSGRDEVYVQSFPDPSHRLQVSTEGGIIPQWSSDGRDVLFLSADDRLMRATLVPSGEGLEVGALEPLFAIPAGSYLVRTDGQRFLFFTTTQQASPITLLLNWSGAR